MELTEYRSRWKAKPVLRAIYNKYYDIILDNCIRGSILEIGGGSGNFKERMPNAISIDIQPAPWLDAVADAQSLPYKDESFNNIVLVDILHHIEYPVRFLSEASRVLTNGGRLVMLEPAITPLSRLVYRLFHDELVDMHADPFLDGQTDPKRGPFEANQAIPTLIFLRKAKIFAEKFPHLKLIETHYLSLFAYPLSGGYKAWCLLPGKLLNPLLRLEDYLLPMLGPLMAYRLLIIIEKQLLEFPVTK